MITLKDKLSHLSYTQACKMIGAQGKQLIMAGGKYDIDLFEQVTLTSERFHLNLAEAAVEIALDPLKPRRLSIGCSVCSVACEHQGAALSLILEEKLSLGLSAPPPERIPMESLSEEALVNQAIADRKERAQKEKMRLKSMNSHELWTDYIITSYGTGKSYRIATAHVRIFVKTPSAPASTSSMPWTRSGKNSKRWSGRHRPASKRSASTCVTAGACRLACWCLRTCPRKSPHTWPRLKANQFKI